MLYYLECKISQKLKCTCSLLLSHLAHNNNRHSVDDCVDFAILKLIYNDALSKK